MDMLDPTGGAREDERSLLDFFILLAKHKRLIAAWQLGTTLIAGVVLWLLPNVYTGTARIMPPQQGQSTALAAVGMLAGAAGGGAMPAIGQALGLKNPNDLYVGILKGDTISDRIIGRFGLRARYGEDTLIETRDALAKVVNITTGRDGLIVVQVDDEDPKIAADMANAYVEELDRLTQQLAVTEASQRRLFFEHELAAVREKLGVAEDAMRAVQEKTGLIQPDGQAKAIFDAITDLGVRIAAKEVEIAALRTFATAQNPKVLRAQQEVASLKSQLARLENADFGKRTQGDIRVPTAQVPEVGLEYLRRMRDIKYQETLYEVLAKQYELAKIDEGKDAALIQAVDSAVVPDYKSRPKRGLLLVVALFLGTLAGIGCAIARERMAGWNGAPKLERLRSYLRRRCD